MVLPLFFPPVRYVKTIDRRAAVTLERLCAMANSRCEALGAWTQRPIVLSDPKDGPPWLLAEPGDWGAVHVGAPLFGDPVRQARWALGALAYVLFDGVARASVNGKEWARIEQPRGRQHQARRAKTNAERQGHFRARAANLQTARSGKPGRIRRAA